MVVSVGSSQAGGTSLLGSQELDHTLISGCFNSKQYTLLYMRTTLGRIGMFLFAFSLHMIVFFAGSF